MTEVVLSRQEKADALGISREAIDLFAASNVIDLHIDSYIWTRTLGYQLHKSHLPDLQQNGPFGGLLFSQCDLPRVLAAGLTGSTWVITTNPFRGRQGRAAALKRNLDRISTILAQHNDVTLVRTVEDYADARKGGGHAAWLAVQGASALDADLSILDMPSAKALVRFTLVHLTSPAWGSSSLPWSRQRTFTAAGEQLVRALNERRIFVDLAHAHPDTFWQAARVHAEKLPLLVSHTGIAGVRAHWRNLDDDQIRMVARSGGTIGILFHRPYLAGRSGRNKSGCELVVDHMAYVIALVGEDFVSLGSDFDGFILPPRDLRSCVMLPRLVEEMLRRQWRPERIQKILGENWLRALALLHG